MEELRIGFCNLVKAKKEGKIKAYFTMRIGTESFGTMLVEGCKLIEGKEEEIKNEDGTVTKRNSHFVSFPSRQVKAGEGFKYFNTIRWGDYNSYKSVTKETNEKTVPLMLEQLATM